MKVGVFVILSLAVAAEIVGTSGLKASEGFTRLWPVAVVVVGYGVSFYLLALALQYLPLGVVYAIWSGLGTVGTVIVGVLYWRESLDLAGAVGIALIVIGVAVLNLFSGTTAH